MLLAFIVLFVVLTACIVIMKLKNFHLKIFMAVLFTLVLGATIGVCVKNPKMHNRISLNVIDYLIKFNTDGSMTTTKQITTEVIKENQK